MSDLPADDQVYQTVLAIIGEFVEDRAALTSLSRDSRLREDVDIDSVRLVDIWLDVEDHFGITIPEEAMDRVKTLGELIDTVRERLPAS